MDYLHCLYRTLLVILYERSFCCLKTGTPIIGRGFTSCGASHTESLKDITLPLIRPAMLSGFFLIFLPAMRELTTSSLLYGPYTRTLGVAIYMLRSDGYITQASALATLTILLIVVVNWIINFITKERKGV